MFVGDADAHRRHAADRAKLDQVGYWSLETWGGATFDACLRYLNEDPWERLRKLRAAMPNTRFQMLLRGQNVLGYRNYPDDIVRAFCRARRGRTASTFFVSSMP